MKVTIPAFIREVVEHIAFLAREDKKIDKRSGVSQRLPISVLENVVSNTERRALMAQEDEAVPRVVDIYSALPSITGKIELEYEGELKGGDTVARELVRGAIGKVFNNRFDGVNMNPIVQYFDLGGQVELGETVPVANVLAQLTSIQGLMEKTRKLGLGSNESDALRASAAEFVLEGLVAHRRISRSEERVFGPEEKRRAQGGDEPRPRSDPRKQNFQ